MSDGAPLTKVLIGPFMTADWSDYMAGAFCDFDTVSFGPWEGADITMPGVPDLNQIISRLPEGWEPDLFVLWRPEYGMIPAGLEHAPFPTAALISDWYLAYTDCLEAAWRVDALVTGTRGERVYRRAGFEHVIALPMLGYQPELDGCFGLHAEQRDIDVFCGGNPNWRVHRQRALIHEEMKNLPSSVKLWEGPMVDRVEFNRLMGRSRIFVNQTVIGEVNMKVYEATASGTCLFVEEENLDIRDYLVDDESVVLFNRENINQKICYYLEHEEERAAIAALGQQKMAPFTYRRNMRSIIERLTGPEGITSLSGKRPIDRLSAEEQAEGLAGFALRHHYLDRVGCLTASEKLGDGARQLLLKACTHYYTRIEGETPGTWPDNLILKAIASAAQLAPEYLPAAYSWYQVARSLLQGEIVDTARESVLRLLQSGCEVPLPLSHCYFGMEQNNRFHFERTAWEAIENGDPVDDALRPLLLEELVSLKPDAP